MAGEININTALSGHEKTKGAFMRELTFTCKKCNLELEFDIEGERVKVEPCSRCLKSTERLYERLKQFVESTEQLKQEVP